MVGGGLFISGIAGEATINRSQNFDDFDPGTPFAEWEVGGRNLAGSAKTFRGYAICRNAGTQGLKYLSVGAFDRPPGRFTSTVMCPNGTEVVGGGAQVSAVNNEFVRTSRPIDGDDPGHTPDDGWKAGLYNGSGADASGRASVICLRKDRWSVSYVRDRDADVAAGDAGHPIASCPNGTSVAGGGAAVGRGSGEAWLNTSSPVDGADGDSVPDDGWEIYVYNASGEAKDISAFAVCKS